MILNKYAAGIAMFLGFVSCDEAYLDIKPDKKMVVPESLSDVRAILDNAAMNQSVPSIGEVAADDYFVETEVWTAITEVSSKNAYIWMDDVLNVYESNEWSMAYKDILYMNTALETLDKIRDDSNEARDLRGTAYFLRAFEYFHLAQVFCLPWKKEGNKELLGLPLRLGAEVEYEAARVDLEQTYDQILRDAHNSLVYLTNDVSIYKTRPGVAAAHALLGRIYLVMGEYGKALSHADSALAITSTLLNFNEVDVTRANPIERFNEEVIYQQTLYSKSIWATSRQRVNRELLASYEEDDLRSSVYFKYLDDSTAYFCGSYDGTGAQFSGLATNELYYISAECNARLGNTDAAIDRIDAVLKKKFQEGAAMPNIPSERRALISFILKERRKELLFRGLRWTDIRRLNALENLDYTIEKTLDGKRYRLLPNESRYAFLIPDQVIFQSGMQQNLR